MRERLGPGRKREFLVFCALSGIAFAALGSLFAFFAQREETSRRRDLEYRAWQTSSAVLEAYQGGAEFGSELPYGALAFGLYDRNGNPLLRIGKAPAAISPEGIASEPFSGDGFRMSERSVSIARRLGQAGMGPMGGRNRPERKGQRRMMEGVAPDGEGEPAAGNSAPGESRRGMILYVETPLGDYRRRETSYAIARIVVLIAIFGLYVLVAWLYGRVLAFAEREERNRELIQLGGAARTLAHEIKNPLAVIRLQCATLSKLLPDERKANLGVIEEEADRLRLLTDRIGDLLRGGAGEPQDIDLVSWSRSFAERNGLAWSSESPGPRIASIDPGRLESAVGNLAANAVEAGGGSDGVEIRLALEGGKARLDVLDRGPGVPPELEARIFDPFFTTKPRGSGIGLALASKFAREAGGRLEYRRREGGGGQFGFSLPLKGR